jgi:hypothetical protein
MKLVSVVRTPTEKKEFVATFEKDGKRFIRRFGTKSNYVLNKDKTDKDRDNYRKRHRAMKREAQALKDPTTPASLSMELLWGYSRSLSQNVKAFKRKHNL